MKLLFALVCSGLALHAFGQNYDVNFLKGTRTFDPNVATFDPATVPGEDIYQGNYYRFVQFYQIPTDAEKLVLKEKGIQLLEYIPNFTFIVSISSETTKADFESINIRSIQPIDEAYKLSQRVQDQNYPDWATTDSSRQLSIAFYDDVDFATALESLKASNVNVIASIEHANMLLIDLAPEQVETLTDLAFVKYIDVLPDPGKAESDEGRFLHRANTIDGDYYGARDYDGTGVNIAINDDGFVGPHIDFTGRTNQTDVAGDMTGTHGDMVAGIAGGAGNLDPEVRGMATGSYMHIRQYDANSLTSIPLHVDSAVLVFSSSYSNGCNDGYTNVTVLADQEIYDNPTLIQTFSAGNSNNQDCGYGAGSQWGNITGGHKMGKNVIATANLMRDDVVDNSSSRGPASDGRIKPDIAAHGTNHYSTDPDNAYASGGGTSAAAPGIAGVLAQLHQAFRELNGGVTAKSALLKATLLNTANDLGNDGPDFIYGWGKVNALKAVELLEDVRYMESSVSQGNTNTHTITIPAGVERAQIMIYWADKEGSTVAATALVNDLDATVTDPNNTVFMPWLLDHTPNAVNLATPATTGADHLNNMEQIAIDNPIAGTYSIDITGTTVPFGPQEYFVVYEFLTNDVTVIYPAGGEGMEPGTTQRIHWDAYDEANDFTLEYTEDDGGSWTTIASNVNGDERFYDWTAPNTITGEARVRVTQNGNSAMSDSVFTIMERPENIHVYRICADSNKIMLRWDPVPGATGYDVFMLGQKFMDSIGSSNTEDFGVIVADLNDPQWFSVRATGPNQLRSMRQVAIYYPGGFGNGFCILSCYSDADVGISTLNEPLANFQTCSGITSSDVSIDLENMGLTTESNFGVHYQLDNGTIVSETYMGSLAPGASATHVFGTQVNFPSSGQYTLKTWTELNTDSTYCNDTITQIIDVVNAISTFPVTEDFEGPTFPPSILSIDNPDNSMTWEEVSTTGASGGQTTAAFMNNFLYNASGEEDMMSLVNFDLTQVGVPANVYLTFDVAYREYSSSYSDDMRIDASDDCGLSYSQVYYKDGATLATGPSNATNWEPSSASDWRNDTINLSSYIGGNVALRFVNICGYGNNMYIDNINLEVIPTIGLAQLDDLHLQIMPNPASHEATLVFGQALSEETQIQLISMDGKTVSTSVVAEGEKSATIDVSALNPAIYSVVVTSAGHHTVRKIVVND